MKKDLSRWANSTIHLGTKSHARSSSTTNNARKPTAAQGALITSSAKAVTARSASRTRAMAGCSSSASTCTGDTSASGATRLRGDFRLRLLSPEPRWIPSLPADFLGTRHCLGKHSHWATYRLSTPCGGSVCRHTSRQKSTSTTGQLPRQLKRQIRRSPTTYSSLTP